MVDPQHVEALAQLFYEVANPTGVPWSQRRPVIREGWLSTARLRLSEMETEEREMLQHGQDGASRDASHAATRELAVLDAFRRHGDGHRPLSFHTLRRETELDPSVLVSTVHRLMVRGVLGQMAAAMDPSGQAAFRLLDPGHALLANGGIGLWSVPR